MAVDEGFIRHLVDLLSGLGGIRTRRMFGAVGVYSHDQFFAVADEDSLYLRADAVTRPLFEAEGSRPFTFEMKGEVVETAFWRMPESAMDDPDEAVRWGRYGLEAAARKAAAKPKRRPPKAPRAGA